MSDISVARRYAAALYEEATNKGQVDQLDADIALIRDSLEGSPELVRFFSSPVIPREKKASVVTALFESRLQPLTLRFMGLLVEKRREDLFPAVVDAYRGLRDDELGIVEAHVRSALAMDATEEAALKQTLERMTGKQVRLAVTTDAELLGGLVVRIADTVYDGSVRNKLVNLRERLEHGVTLSMN